MLPISIAGQDAYIAHREEVTHLLDAWSGGEAAALERLTPLVIDELRRLAHSYMAGQAAGHTLQPTALVNEAYLRLIAHRPKSWENRHHFVAYMATIMRRLLVNHARDRKVEKRGGGAPHVALDELDRPHCPWLAGHDTPDAAQQVELLALDRALEALAGVDPQQARIVELRYFGGLTNDEVAQALGLSTRTVKREWHAARLWLLRALSNG